MSNNAVQSNVRVQMPVTTGVQNQITSLKNNGFNLSKYASIVDGNLVSAQNMNLTQADLGLIVKAAQEAKGATADDRVAIVNSLETALAKANLENASKTGPKTLSASKFQANNEVAETEKKFTAEEAKAKADKLIEEGVEVPTGLTEAQVLSETPNATAKEFVQTVMEKGGIEEIGNARTVAA